MTTPKYYGAMSEGNANRIKEMTQEALARGEGAASVLEELIESLNIIGVGFSGWRNIPSGNDDCRPGDACGTGSIAARPGQHLRERRQQRWCWARSGGPARYREEPRGNDAWRAAVSRSSIWASMCLRKNLS